MNIYLISDTHFNHANISTYCQRPGDFTDIIIKNWQNIVRPEDTIIHLGDVIMDKKTVIEGILKLLPGKKILIRGNHDRQWSNTRWMDAGFDFSCDGLMFRNQWLTHEPSNSRPGGCEFNIHGHLHNIWTGFNNWSEGHKQRDEKLLSETPINRLKHPWQRLFAIEYTNYMPVEFNKFVSHPDRYQARGPQNGQG